MKTVILAGGRGTRISEETGDKWRYIRVDQIAYDFGRMSDVILREPESYQRMPSVALLQVPRGP